MKEYLILKDFTGSQTGLDTDTFVAGTTRELSDALVAALGGEAGGFVKPAAAAAKEIANAPAELADAVLDTIADPESRETKVTGPDETKPLDVTKLNKKQLVAFAKDNFGLELNEDDKKDDLLAAIEAATAA